MVSIEFEYSFFTIQKDKLIQKQNFTKFSKSSGVAPTSKTRRNPGHSIGGAISES